MKKEKKTIKEENCYGFNVRIKYKDGRKEIRNNVTEIHYNYPSLIGRQVAFESDIHGTGGSVFIDEIEEFEAILANKKEKDY